MRIGLITLYSDDNPGEFFQALASAQALRAAFPEAQIELPDIQHWHHKITGASRRDAILNPARNRVRIARHTAYEQARAMLLPIVGPPVVTPDPSEACREIARRHYDLLVVGSDATLYLWGTQKVKDNLPPLHYLADVPDVPRACLSSCSHTVRFDQLSDVQRQIMTRAIKKFRFLAVRDELTKELMETLGPAEGVSVRVSPDPTLSYEIDLEPGKAACEAAGIRKRKPVCGLNLPAKSPLAAELVGLLRRQFDVVQISTNHRGCKDLLLGPMEWCGAFSNFDLHVTTGFHDTIFCLKQGTPVFTLEGDPSRFDSKTGRSKCYSVHEMVGTLDHCHINPFLMKCSAEDVYQQICENWQNFDRDRAIRRTRELGQQYLNTVADMRQTCLPLLDARV